MEFEIKQLGQTLAIGGLTVFGVSFFIWYVLRDLFDYDLLTVINAPVIQNVKLMFSAIYLALIFAFGILVEDLSKNLVADRPPVILLPLFDFLLPKDVQLRTSSLYEFKSFPTDPKEEKDRCKTEFFKAKAKALLIDLVDLDLFEHYGGKAGESINKYYHDLGFEKLINDSLVYEGGDFCRLTNAVTNLYYHAKNRVYLKTTYFNELNQIKSRFDFSRSFAFVNGVFLYYHLLFVLSLLIASTLKKIRRKNHRRLLSKKRVFILFGLLVYFAISSLLGKTAYQSEQMSFNLRVFGYFRSLHRTDKRPTVYDMTGENQELRIAKY